jgi:hypothetical protein
MRIFKRIWIYSKPEVQLCGILKCIPAVSVHNSGIINGGGTPPVILHCNYGNGLTTCAPDALATTAKEAAKYWEQLFSASNPHIDGYISSNPPANHKANAIVPSNDYARVRVTVHWSNNSATGTIINEDMPNTPHQPTMADISIPNNLPASYWTDSISYASGGEQLTAHPGDNTTFDNQCIHYHNLFSIGLTNPTRKYIQTSNGYLSPKMNNPNHMPADDVDLLSLLIHEIGHAMGVRLNDLEGPPDPVRWTDVNRAYTGKLIGQTRWLENPNWPNYCVFAYNDAEMATPWNFLAPGNRELKNTLFTFRPNDGTTSDYSMGHLMSMGIENGWIGPAMEHSLASGTRRLPTALDAALVQMMTGYFITWGTASNYLYQPFYASSSAP